MHPTPEEQLQAVLRLIDAVATDPGIAPESQEILADAGRLIRRLRRSWARRLPFIVRDNELAAELLAGFSPRLPELADEIQAAAASLPVDDEPSAHEVNKQLQDLLGRAVHLLPDDAEGDAARVRIADHLRARLAADPALNRTPTDRLPPEDPTP